ncbi:hypothetical protein Cgig2_030914 [Carnegiea gigantea]|uniref:non-specific serine/threonine protein kinase n=1 Tax=Carnegiea gigantea TaxID=171969 RepID=A0A9Q1QJ17_9CARY|nr:hypothetical protein Cgig2_030914 [Carnegiea gigantea]
MKNYFLLFLSSGMCFLLVISTTDRINSTQSIEEGEGLVSAGGSFELGFFDLGNNGRKYVGIRYKRISAKTVVWIANRETPLVDSIGVLKLTKLSSVVLLNGKGGIVWSNNSSRSVQNPILQLLDSGNLVVRDKDDQNPEDYLWQSFDHPCHIDLPGMKLGRNMGTGLDRHLTSWRSGDDPSPGAYTYQIDPRGYPQLFLKKGTVIQYRSGPWNGIGFSANPRLKPNRFYTYNFVLNDKEMYFIYEPVDNSVLSMKVLNEDGSIVHDIWDDRTQGWVTYANPVSDNCDIYALCGPFARCSADTPVECECLTGFVPKVPRAWEVGEWSDGCVRKTFLNCGKSNGFLTYSNVKLPDTRYSWYNTNMTLDECKVRCLQNCSCIAYATLDVKEQRGCLLWFDILVDIKVFSEHDQVLYVRMDASELGKMSCSFDPISNFAAFLSGLFIPIYLKKKASVYFSPLFPKVRNRSWFCDFVSVAALPSGKQKWKIQIAASFTAVGVLLLSISTALYAWSRKRLKREAKARTPEEECDSNNNKRELDLPLFALKLIVQATNNFADFNKLGEGGFGAVYKGVLEGGQEIAVKRLSHDSRQGHKEFKNEVKCIAKLQHRNLVKLIGYCNEEAEQLLVYEFMPNKSLDAFIFDQARSMLLDWPMRFEIICGIARGLVYLHQDSRMRIIHRDLKASNILLDHEMKPKISDFGMARMFDGEEFCAKTTRVVGTYGYMSPEYAVDGIFSTKSDVFSFGVLVLEVVSGQSNRGFSHPCHHHNLLGHVVCGQSQRTDTMSTIAQAWRLFNGGQAFELINRSVATPENAYQILRLIHVGLLCVQEYAEDRPSMPLVTVMLSGDSRLPWPKQPGFYVRRHAMNGEVTVSDDLASSGNMEAITVLSARGSFEFGFFSPGNHCRKSVEIRYRKISAMTVVWVAARETSLVDSTGTLELVNNTGNIVWSYNSSTHVGNLVLWDSGDLVVGDKTDQNSENYLWEIFDYPCHIKLYEAGQELGHWS